MLVYSEVILIVCSGVYSAESWAVQSWAAWVLEEQWYQNSDYCIMPKSPHNGRPFKSLLAVLLAETRAAPCQLSELNMGVQDAVAMITAVLPPSGACLPIPLTSSSLPLPHSLHHPQKLLLQPEIALTVVSRALQQTNSVPQAQALHQQEGL